MASSGFKTIANAGSAMDAGDCFVVVTKLVDPQTLEPRDQISHSSHSSPSISNAQPTAYSPHPYTGPMRPRQNYNIATMTPIRPYDLPTSQNDFPYPPQPRTHPLQNQQSQLYGQHGSQQVFDYSRPQQAVVYTPNQQSLGYYGRSHVGPPPQSNGILLDRQYQNGTNGLRHPEHRPSFGYAPQDSSPTYAAEGPDNFEGTRTHWHNLIGARVAEGQKLKTIDDMMAHLFVFPDLSVRTEGDFRLQFEVYNLSNSKTPRKFDLEGRVEDDDVIRDCPVLAINWSAPFRVYSAKKFPGVPDTTAITKKLYDQGVKVAIRKDSQGKNGNGKRRNSDDEDEDESPV
jgi:hypothetical protein